MSPVLCVLPCSRKSFDSDEMGIYDEVFCDLSMLCDCKRNTLAALEVFQSYKGFQKCNRVIIEINKSLQLMSYRKHSCISRTRV